MIWRTPLTDVLNWLHGIFFWAPPWFGGMVVMVLSGLVALAFYRAVFRLLRRTAARFSPFGEKLLQRSEGPLAVIWLTSVLGTALAPAQLPVEGTAAIGRMLLVAFVLAVGWASMNALNLGADLYLQRYRMDVEDNLLARTHVTQVRILRGASKTMLIVVTIATALMTFPAVREYGVSLFASAGAAGLLVGLSARPLLSNLIAGIQIAMTQPMRVEDAVVVEGEWGWIETIASTYVVIRIWDLRRLIVPLTYFIEKPFQNWTYQKSELLGSVILNVDFTVPMEPLRGRLEEIVRETPLWDGKVVVLQVTDVVDNLVQLRALVSARSGPAAWDLRCYVREQLIAYLQEHYAHALPRQRMDVDAWPERRDQYKDGEPQLDRDSQPSFSH